MTYSSILLRCLNNKSLPAEPSDIKAKSYIIHSAISLKIERMYMYKKLEIFGIKFFSRRATIIFRVHVHTIRIYIHVGI